MTPFLVARKMNVGFLDHTKCELGEGPTFDPVQNKAWWFNIVGKALFEHDFSNGQTSRLALPFMASMLAVIDERTQLIAAEDGIYVRNMASNELSLHLPLEAHNMITRSNDGRVHPCGALWIGTMGKNAEQNAGAIYHYQKGKITKIFEDITIPNAICFSPDGRTGYYTDTTKGNLISIAIDPLTALPIAKPIILYDHEGKKGGLDGAVTASNGDILCALWGASSILHLSASGAVIEAIPLPVTQPTCPCFVGKNLDQLLVTSAWQGKPSPADTKGNAGKTLILNSPAMGKSEPRVLLK
jgi:sugar lactone lactonase YvrE